MPMGPPMNKSAHLDSLASLENVARPGAITCSDTPNIILGHGPLVTMAICEDPAISLSLGKQR
jgi:hypothetical protein